MKSFFNKVFKPTTEETQQQVMDLTQDIELAYNDKVETGVISDTEIEEIKKELTIKELKEEITKEIVQELCMEKIENVEEFAEDVIEKVKVSYTKNACWIVFLLCIIFTPIVYTYMNHLNVGQLVSGYSLSAYSILSFLYFFFKVIFSLLNYRNSKKFNKEIEGPLPSIGVQITGWREDPNLFERTLISIKNQTYQNITRITVCSDGNEKDDLYMGEIFQKVFPTGQLIHTNKFHKDMTKKQQKKFYHKVNENKYTCILQPHGGKRHAMHTQLKTLSNKILGCDLIMLVDSDCIFAQDAIEILAKTHTNTDATAVTGDVRIYNPDNLLSYLISLKFWFAFNMERNAQSYFGTVSCVPGPFGLYSSSMIRQIVDIWIGQTLFGKECTFGDDRHLTNLVLMRKGKIYYNDKAKCYTDTPTTIQRFISQQNRWCKSFIREYFYNVNSFSFKTFWLAFELTFTFFVALYVIFLIITIFLQFDITYILALFASIFSFSYIRTLYAIIISRDLSFIVFPLYSWVYFFFLFPLKIWAGLTINVTNWGTGNRLIKSFKIVDSIPTVTWNSFMFCCTIYATYLKFGNYSQWDLILLAWIIVNTTTLVIIYNCIKGKYQRQMKQLLDDIVAPIETEEQVEIEIDRGQSLEQLQNEIDSMPVHERQETLDRLQERIDYMIEEITNEIEVVIR